MTAKKRRGAPKKADKGKSFNILLRPSDRAIIAALQQSYFTDSLASTLRIALRHEYERINAQGNKP